MLCSMTSSTQEAVIFGPVEKDSVKSVVFNLDRITKPRKPSRANPSMFEKFIEFFRYQYRTILLGAPSISVDVTTVD